MAVAFTILFALFLGIPVDAPQSRPAEPADADSLIEAGRKALEEDPELATSRLEKAIAILEKMIADDASRARSWFLLGRARFYLARDTLAAAAFDKAVELEPGFADARFFRGLVHRFSGETESALGQFREAVRLDPTKADYSIELARALTSAGQEDEALTVLEAAIARVPGSARLRRDAGDLAHQKGDDSAAKRHYERAFELEGTDAKTAYKLGQVERNLGHLEAAQGWFGKAFVADPKYWEALAAVVQLAEMRGDTAKRDESRKRLYALREDGLIPALVEATGYARDRYSVDGTAVIVEERFQRTPPWYQEYIFHVARRSEGSGSYILSYGSIEDTTLISRELGQVGPEDRMYHIDVYRFDEEGGMQRHETVVMSPTAIPYERIKAIVNERIRAMESP